MARSGISFLTPDLLVTILGPTHAALNGDEARCELVTVRSRLDAATFHPASAFDIVSALRFGMLRTQEIMIGSAASRIALLEQRMLHTSAR